MLTIFLLDQYSKIKVIDYLLENNKIFINEYLNFNLTWNTGIGFGLLSFSSGLIYNLISFLIFLVLCYLTYLLIISKKIDQIFYSMIIGGAVGNLYDRITKFAVPDFIDFHYKDFHWFTFNIADIFICIGIFMVIIRELLKKNET
tara:strand:- start:1342 stop:1776 length:435 start_codon:yes stop_codon:yes gene_type:complete